MISAGYHPDVPTTAELRETGTVSKRKNIGERFVKDLQKWQNEIDRPAMKEDIQKLIDLSRIILNKKAIDNERFFLRYDKTLNNILGKYDEIENTGLDTEEIRQTMHNVEQNLRKIVIAFQNDVNNLYKSDLVSINAETSAFVQDLHNKGLLDNE